MLYFQKAVLVRHPSVQGGGLLSISQPGVLKAAKIIDGHEMWIKAAQNKWYLKASTA